MVSNALILLILDTPHNGIDMMNRLIGDSFGIVLAILRIALQIINLIEPQHDVMINVSDLEDSQQL